MPKKVRESKTKKIRPALTDEAREQRMINLAMQRAEEQLLNGTASSQVITHFLKLGSSKEKLEKQIREDERELIRTKVDGIKQEQTDREDYKKVIAAMQRYSGNEIDEDDWDETY